MSMQFAVNAIIEWLPASPDQDSLIERILWIDGSGAHVVLIAISEPDPLPVLKSSAEIAEAISAESAFRRLIDPFAHLTNYDPQFVEKHRERMDRAWSIIKDIAQREPEIYLDEYRGRLIRDASDEFKIASKEIYRYLRRYWIAGKTRYALLPAYQRCGGPGKERRIEKADPNMPKRGRPPRRMLINPEDVGVNVDEEMKNIFRIALRLYYHKGGENPLKRAYQTMLENHFHVGYREEGGVRVAVLPPASQVPTLEQFSYFNRKERRLVESIISREGRRRYDLNSRPILGNSTQMASGPGSIFQVDATIADVYLVSSLNRHWIIGRPVVYFVVDVFSRMIVGLYVGLEGPSWISGMMAIVNATTDKVAFCAEYGVEITHEVWPCVYLPGSILADRGEFVGLESDRLPGSTDIPLSNCPPYRADWKGIVEQMFRRVNLKTIKWLPGSVRKRERGEKDHRLDATLDLRQFTRIVILSAIQYNLHHRIEDYPMDLDLIRDGVEPVPIELWEWGIANRAGHLRERPPELIKLDLMPRKTATVTERGILFEGMHYSTERALQKEWYVRARRDGTWKVPVSYDPRRLGAIYLPNKEESLFDVCTLLPKDERFKDQILEEMQDHFALQSIRSDKHEDRRRQSTAQLKAQVAAIEAEALRKKEEESPPQQSKTQRIKGIRANRAAEKEMNRETEAFNLRPEEKPSRQGIVLPIRPMDPGHAAEPVVTPATRRNDLLSILQQSLQGNDSNNDHDSNEPSEGEEE